MWTLQQRQSSAGFWRFGLRGHGVAGFSLAEVIIVSVVMTVLLATVWSLFVMQQRTLERGQRLSRDTRVVLALQRQMQDDFSRLVLRRWEARESGGGGGSGPTLAASDGAEWPRFDRSSAADRVSVDAVPAEFRLAGGSDWLIIDVRRPAYQWGAFDGVGAEALEDSTAFSSGLGAASGIGGGRGGVVGDDDPDRLPQRSPTAFQRIIYLWLTDEEIEEVAGLQFGRADDETGSGAVSQSASESVAGAMSLTSGAEGVEERGVGRRTLVRLVTDWSWPREGELGGETWDAALGGLGAADRSGMDFAVGLPGSSGSTTPERRQWLRRLLLGSDAYRDFHRQAGSAVDLGTASTADTEVDPRAEVGNFAGTGGRIAGMNDATSVIPEEYLLPDRWQPQVDWFPEVVAGKFLYHDGARWQTGFTEREDRKLPQAIRFEYTVDARWFPVTVNEAVEADPAGVVSPLGPTSLPSEALGVAADALASSGSQLAIDLNDRPEFPHVVGYTFFSRASGRDASMRDGEGDGLDEGDDGSADPFSTLGGNAGLEGGGTAIESAAGALMRRRGF